MANNKKSFIVIAPYQFGELSDCFYWCKYGLKKGYKVTYIGYRYNDSRRHERNLEGVNIVAIKKLSNRFLFGVVFILRIIFEILKTRERNVIICRFPHAEIIAKLFFNRNIYLDIRTLSINKDFNQRELENNAIINQMKQFKKCSIISQGTRDLTGISAKLLPLGAESISDKKKTFETIRLLYIGTYNGRNLDLFIKGLGLFEKKTGISLQFDIVGSGSEEEQNKINDVIKEYGLDKIVQHGFLDHDQAKWLFDDCNVGVCFVPVTDYYDYQPPTKLYEYLLSGMACIATKTYSNSAVVKENNGVLVEDSPYSVADGLLQLYSKRHNFSSSVIVAETQQYHWERIFNDYFEPLLES